MVSRSRFGKAETSRNIQVAILQHQYVFVAEGVRAAAAPLVFVAEGAGAPAAAPLVFVAEGVGAAAHFLLIHDRLTQSVSTVHPCAHADTSTSYLRSHLSPCHCCTIRCARRSMLRTANSSTWLWVRGVVFRCGKWRLMPRRHDIYAYSTRTINFSASRLVRTIQLPCRCGAASTACMSWVLAFHE